MLNGKVVERPGIVDDCQNQDFFHQCQSRPRTIKPSEDRQNHQNGDTQKAQGLILAYRRITLRGESQQEGTEAVREPEQQCAEQEEGF